jgi:hypothetical protein
MASNALLAEKDYIQILQTLQKCITMCVSLIVAVTGFLYRNNMDTKEQKITLFITASLGSFIVFLQTLEKLDDVNTKSINYSTAVNLLDNNFHPAGVESTLRRAITWGKIVMDLRTLAVGLLSLAISVIGSATTDLSDVIEENIQMDLLTVSSSLAVVIVVIETVTWCMPYGTTMGNVAHNTSHLYGLVANATVTKLNGFAAGTTTDVEEQKNMARKLRYAGQFVD